MVWHITSLAQGVRELSNPRKFPTPETHNCDQVIANLVELYAEAFCKCYSRDAASPSTIVHRVMLSQMTAAKVAIQSLMDFRATAALAKELIFNSKGNVADLGAGSGILGVCAGIGSLRTGIEAVSVHCIERESDMANALRKLAAQLRPRIALIIKEADITHADTIRDLSTKNIGTWVSETINSDTIPLHIDNDTVRMGEGYHSLCDPYPKVLKNLVENVPDFLETVRAGDVKLFPDIVNGAYLPKGQEGWIELRTSRSHKNGGDLRKVGKDFTKLTSKMTYRWP